MLVVGNIRAKFRMDKTRRVITWRWNWGTRLLLLLDHHDGSRALCGLHTPGQRRDGVEAAAVADGGQLQRIGALHLYAGWGQVQARGDELGVVSQDLDDFARRGPQ